MNILSGQLIIQLKNNFSSHSMFYSYIIIGSLGVVKNIEFKIVAYLPRFFMLVFVKFYVFIYRILLYFVI